MTYDAALRAAIEARKCDICGHDIIVFYDDYGTDGALCEWSCDNGQICDCDRCSIIVAHTS